MESAWETNAADEVRRISSFLSVCARADKGNRSVVSKLPATILAFAGFVSTAEFKVTCSYCHYEPDLEKIQDIVKKAPISILFVLILEHLTNAQTCMISKLCFVAYFSKEQIHETLNNIVISSKKNLKQDSSLELDCKQGFQTDCAKQITLEVKLPISADSLSFESLAKRCKDTTNMKSAEARLLTFKNWCFTHVVTPLALACDGFYRHESKSASDSVKCVYCGLTLFQWEPNDIVSMEHRDKSPTCPFKTGKVANDISLNEIEVYYHRCLTMFRSKLFDEKVLRSDQDFNATVKKILNLFSIRDNLMLTNEAIFSKLSIDIQSPGECGAVGGRLEFDSLMSEPQDDKKSEINKLWKKKKDPSPNLSEEEIQSAILTISEENSRLKESKLCKICVDKDINTVFLPCGHLVSCQGCAPRIKTCAVCRTLILGTVLAFIPND